MQIANHLVLLRCGLKFANFRRAEKFEFREISSEKLTIFRNSVVEILWWNAYQNGSSRSEILRPRSEFRILIRLRKIELITDQSKHFTIYSNIQNVEKDSVDISVIENH